MSAKSRGTQNSIEPRTVRAATESMTVVPHENGEFTVYSGETSEYTVNTDDGTCTCPDHEHRESHCKHQRRCEMEAGSRPIPDLPGRLDVELMTPQVSSEPTGEPLRADGGVEDECSNPDCEYGQNKERPVLCYPHWRKWA